MTGSGGRPQSPNCALLLQHEIVPSAHATTTAITVTGYSAKGSGQPPVDGHYHLRAGNPDKGAMRVRGKWMRGTVAQTPTIRLTGRPDLPVSA